MTPEDRRLLSMTFGLALKGRGRTSPNPIVGALVARSGRILATGYHARAGEEHAETIALKEAGGEARGADLYVNLEPCCHQGRTPPCVAQIAAAGIARVVAAVRDPFPLVDGRGFKALLACGITVEPIDTVFARRAAMLNEVFFRYATAGRPFVALKAGATLDGRIALSSGASKWITDEGARAEGRALRGIYDAVMVGVGTVLADDPLLLPPGGGAEGGRRVRIVVDSSLRIPPASRLVGSVREAPLLVVAAAGPPAAARRSLERAGVEVLEAGEGKVDLPRLLEILGRREITSVLVEGGGDLLASFLHGGLADKIHLFLAPRLLGGRASPGIFGGEAPADLSAAAGLEEISVRRAGEALLVEGYLGGRTPRTES